MASTEVLYNVADKIATITFNRPDQLNAWTLNMDGAYREAMAEAEKDDKVRVIIVTGAGKGFCAGADMGLLSSITGGNTDVGPMSTSNAQPGSQNGSARKDFQQKYSFPPAVHKPIIAAVNGAAVGLGLVHALFCDIRIASDTAKFAVIFPQRGLIAEYGLAWLLPRIVGMGHAMDLLMSGRVIKADEAQRMNLVNRVVPADKLMDEVRAYAEQLAVHSSPRSTAVIKRQAYEALFTDLNDALSLAETEMLQSLACDDFREGVTSFLEKRAPAFTGN